MQRSKFVFQHESVRPLQEQQVARDTRVPPATKSASAIPSPVQTKRACPKYPPTSTKASLFRPRESLRHIPSATDANIVDMIIFTFSPFARVPEMGVTVRAQDEHAKKKIKSRSTKLAAAANTSEKAEPNEH